MYVCMYVCIHVSAADETYAAKNVSGPTVYVCMSVCMCICTYVAVKSLSLSLSLSNRHKFEIQMKGILTQMHHDRCEGPQSDHIESQMEKIQCVYVCVYVCMWQLKMSLSLSLSLSHTHTNRHKFEIQMKGILTQMHHDRCEGPQSDHIES